MPETGQGGFASLLLTRHREDKLNNVPGTRKDNFPLVSLQVQL